MRSKKRAQQIVFLLLISGGFLLIFSLMKRPFAKAEKIDYVIGDTVPLQAKVYLGNVSDDSTVSMDMTQFQVSEAMEKKINLTYQGTSYKVNINFIAPDINQLIKVSDRVQDFVISGNYQSVFGVDERYAKDVTYSIPSDQLKLGEQTVSATLYGQTVSQKLYVYDDSNDMGRLSIRYDYANQDLTTIVKQYLTDEKLTTNQVAFSYVNTATKKVVQMNENQSMIAGSTYKLPLSMFVEDEMKTRGYTLNTIVLGTPLKELLEQTIVESSNHTAEMLVEYFGGFYNLYQQKFGVYGKNEHASIKTIDVDTNRTTAYYFKQVLEYVWANQDKYPYLIGYLKEATPNRYYEMYLQRVDIWHKYGLYDDAINDVAIVHERNPYLIALYTQGLTEYQFGKLAYVINEWHRINQDK
ncbi:serine hydrolase [Granulicatella sp. 19428wC4_WM01]